MDVGLGFLNPPLSNLRYERLCTDQFALIVAQNHPWANRRMVDFQITPATPPSIARQLCDAQNVGRNLSKHRVARI